MCQRYSFIQESIMPAHEVIKSYKHVDSRVLVCAADIA